MRFTRRQLIDMGADIEKIEELLAKSKALYAAARAASDEASAYADEVVAAYKACKFGTQ